MDNKEKFTNKVDDYVKYRPSYPDALIEYLTKKVGIGKNSKVADIGAGTGIFTKQLADKVEKIYAVEPNKNMLKACTRYCGEYSNVITVGGSSDATNLPDKCVEFISVAQAFHWFDRQKTKVEFQRILKSGGKVVLVWNSRVPESELIKENDALCRGICPEFKGFSGGDGFNPEEFSDFFKNGFCEYRLFDNNRLLDLESYIGSSLSSSYAPSKGDINYDPFVKGLTKLFNKYSHNGVVLIPNKTRCYVGEL